MRPWSDGVPADRINTIAAMGNGDVPRLWSVSWPMLVRGGLTLVFGVTALLLLVLTVLLPGIVAALLLTVFAAFVLIDGAFGVGLMVFGRGARRDRVQLMARTAVAVGLTLAVFSGPIVAGQPAERLATLVSAWAVLNGVLDVAAGSGLSAGPRQRWQMVLGATSLALGASLMAWPPGMIAMTCLIVAFSVAYGVVTIFEASRSVRLD